MRLFGDAVWRRVLLAAWVVEAALLLLEAAAGLPAVWHDRLPSWGFQAQHTLGLARLDGASLAATVHAAEPREAARLRSGDRLQFPQVAERWLVPPSGSEVQLLRQRDGATEPIRLRAEARAFTPSERFDYLCRLVQALPAMAFALLLALQRPLAPVNRSLCVAFLCFAMVPFLNFSFSLAVLPLAVKQASFLSVVLGGYQVTRFALEQLRALPGRWGGIERLLTLLRLASLVAAGALLAYLNGRPIPWLGALLMAVLGGQQLLTLLTLGWAHARSSGRKRLRLRFLLAAFLLGVLPLSVLMQAGPDWQGFDPGALQWPLVLLFLSYLLSYIGLGWGMLRHRVLDLYVVFDQALVYAVALLPITAAVFALKYLAEQPFLAWTQGLDEGHEKQFIQVGFVFAAYLAGHFSFHWLDHRVQHLVFRRRHERQAALRRLLHAAPQGTRQEALLQTLHRELERFGEGAGNAIYLRLAGGDYVQVFNTLARAPHLLEGDDALLVKMRSEARPRWLDSGGSGPGASEVVGALALPMLRRGQVFALVVLGERPDGELYRADEVALLQQVLAHVALDLQALAAAGTARPAEGMA